MVKKAKEKDSFLRFFLGWEFHIKNDRFPTKEELDKLVEETGNKKTSEV